MNKVINKNIEFHEVIANLGFTVEDDCLYLTVEESLLSDPQVQFHIEIAREINATAVYLRRQLNGSYKPQVYLFDFTDRNFEEVKENEVAEIQTKIWSSGEAPLACIFYNTIINIIDCTKHITKDYKPEYLVKDLKLIGKADNLYNEQFAIKIKSGVFWEQEELKSKFKFQNSAYDTLIKNIHFVASELIKKFKDTSLEIVNKIIIQAILIKYLEERIDIEGNELLSEKYFQKYDKATTFNEVLKQQGKFVELLSDLNKDFNGNVFKWEIEEQKQLNTLDLSIVADLLATDKTDLSSLQHELDFDWRYFKFKLIPVELISRLYEEFLGEDKQEKGLYYTPAHLAKLLVDECIPLKKYNEIDPENFSILDPACGSGIFLVITFKRLVQIWRLKNNMKSPSIDVLKTILKNIYGVDKEEQAVRLASFSLSLALCNELNPVKILNELRFDDLTEENLIYSDFFECKSSIVNKKFDLVIGNPPFIRGKLPKGLDYWKSNNKKIGIPQKQIALKFLSESFYYLKDSGLVCLIIKSSGLLYNSTSFDYKKALFSNYNAIQILDFTALARNKSLWDNGADVASAAIFIKNEKPDFSKNILHLTFRRTKATKERIVFEIDDYDLHFVNRQTAINNEFIWKNNLLGGGRIKNLVEKAQALPLLQELLDKNNCDAGEGYIIGNNGNHKPNYIFNYQTLPTEAISNKGIEYELLTEIDKNLEFVKVTEELMLKAPNIIIWENIGLVKLPVFFNEVSFSFKAKIISIATYDNDKTVLKNIVNSFNSYSDFYRFYMYVTSSQILINLNTAVLKKDYMDLRFLYGELIKLDFFSHFDKQVISDVNIFYQDFIRHGEKSKALQAIKPNIFETVIANYGTEFSRALNSIYEDKDCKFRLSDVIQLENSLIATAFKYDSENTKPKFGKDLSELNIDGLTNNQISAHLSVNRIIKLYPQKDTVVFIKPNQYRYWLSLAAYRDADKCFSDFSNLTEG